MAITALHSAATGLRALSTRIDVVANNLANAETTAFKRSRLNFEDLYYLTLRQPGTVNAAGDVSPAGISVGLGTKISNSQLDLEQGSLESTGRPLDVGIQGQPEGGRRRDDQPGRPGRRDAGRHDEQAAGRPAPPHPVRQPPGPATPG